MARNRKSSYAIGINFELGVLVGRQGLTVEINLGTLGGIFGRKYNISPLTATPYNILRIGNHIGFDAVHPEVAHVDVFGQGIKHFAFGVTNIIL